ncbi:hypothetical protein K435DRAFT_747568 [Dendrothele bispora CBS 962.96]|uniref:Zn(2)-C6 fungal-type domain-containing protein n=1 Tax=Dendrothele bispora (strain CBS 962.96) TaxID=1314807 RepID=A0A4S8MLC4_DENBC|nr:hypothetical protein K435DRAFT_747568 [Dendrothele bispora CBS 962.96]
MIPAGVAKKKRLQNPCDECRRRKVRCDKDPERTPGDTCNSCSSLRIACTYSKTPQKRGPKPGSTRTTAALPVGVLVTCILAATNSEPFIIPEEDDVTRRILFKLATRIRTLEREIKQYQEINPLDSPGTSELSTPHPTDSSEPVPSSGSDGSDNKLDDLSKQFSQFSFGLPSKTHFGESSSYTLLLAAMDHRKKVNGPNSPDWSAIFSRVRRPELWDLSPVPSWLKTAPQPSSFEFPPSRLLHHLINIYFVEQNAYTPLLHRPTVEKLVSQGLHICDDSFGAVVLAVCALGARLSSSSPIKNRPGAQWFNQIRIENYVFRENLELYHLQLYSLCLMYLHYIGDGIDDSWLLSGIAIRRAYEKGIHRRYPQRPTVEGELWKRAFWMLIFHETRISTVFGRPGATSIQDFDLDAVIECEDEYWEPEVPVQAFVQPQNEPSTISYWNSYLKLMEIYSTSLLTIYPVRKSEPGAMTGKRTLRWSEKAVMELDSALNEWVDSIPEHLQRDQQHKTSLFFSQSALLYTTYYWVQIQVHRPFIPHPSQSTGALSLSSLAICTSAAKSMIHVCETYCRRAFLQYQGFLIPLLNAATILSLNMTRSIHLKLNFDPGKEMTDIYKCIDLMRLYESRYLLAGRFIDIVNVMVFASGYPPRSIDVTSSNPSEPQQTSNEAPLSSDFSSSSIGSEDPVFVTNSSLVSQNLPSYSNELSLFDIHSGTSTNYPSNSSYLHSHTDESYRGVDSDLVRGVHGPPLSEDYFQSSNYNFVHNKDNVGPSNEPSSEPRQKTPTASTETSDIWGSVPSHASDWESFVAGVDQVLNWANVPSASAGTLDDRLYHM